MRHVRTDPACSRHRRPRGKLSTWWFDRHRGRMCPPCGAERLAVHGEASRVEALRLIDRDGCENLTRGRCSDDPGRTRDSQYTSTQWCPPCIAADALAES